MERATSSDLRHLEWLIREPVPDPGIVYYEILPYNPTDVNVILRQLCELAGFDLGQASAAEERVRQAFSIIVEAARDWEAACDLERIEEQTGLMAKPAWRRRMRALRDGRIGFAAAISDKSIRLALRLGLTELGLMSRAGRRWLHYLRKRPDVQRKALNQLLSRSSLLFNPGGRPRQWRRTEFVLKVGRAYKELTGQPLRRSVTSGTKSSLSGKPTGPGFRLVRVCLQPLEPDVTDEAIAQTIKRAPMTPGVRPASLC